MRHLGWDFNFPELTPHSSTRWSIPSPFLNLQHFICTLDRIQPSCLLLLIQTVILPSLVQRHVQNALPISVIEQVRNYILIPCSITHLHQSLNFIFPWNLKVCRDIWVAVITQPRLIKDIYTYSLTNLPSHPWFKQVFRLPNATPNKTRIITE